MRLLKFILLYFLLFSCTDNDGLIENSPIVYLKGTWALTERTIDGVLDTNCINNNVTYEFGSSPKVDRSHRENCEERLEPGNYYIDDTRNIITIVFQTYVIDGRDFRIVKDLIEYTYEKDIDDDGIKEVVFEKFENLNPI